MNHILSILPSCEDGYLPLFLLISGLTGFGTTVQSFRSLSTARRLYNGRFVHDAALARKFTSSTEFHDSVNKLKPAPDTKDINAKANDQVTPLAGRLFGAYTFLAGIIRVYAAYNVNDPSLYQMAWWAYVTAAVHFTTETVVYKTMRFSGVQITPYVTAYTGMVWMLVQYQYYVPSNRS